MRPGTSRRSSSHRWLVPTAPAKSSALCLPGHSALNNCLLCLDLICPVGLHRRHGVLLPQCPWGCASMVSTAETKHPEAATARHHAELLSRGCFTTTESFSTPSRHHHTPALHVHNRHRHCESRDVRPRVPKTPPECWSLEMPPWAAPPAVCVPPGGCVVTGKNFPARSSL